MDNPEKLATYIRMVHKTKKNKTKTQYNMRWTPLSETNTNNVNKT